MSRVLWIYSDPILPSLQSYVVVAAAAGMRVGDQISSTESVAPRPMASVLPESEIAVAQIVRSTPQGVDRTDHRSVVRLRSREGHGSTRDRQDALRPRARLH